MRQQAAAIQTGGPPVISFVIPVHNQIKHTVACVGSLFMFPPSVPFEIIIGNDQSTDLTGEYLRKFPRTTVLNHEFGSFLHNVNESAKAAHGDVIVILNNDTIMLPGSVDALLATLRGNPRVGLVGSRLLYPDGRLQEAGGYVFGDASAANYGRGADPERHEFNYMRDVDYCSAAAIAIRRPLWEALRGFDTRYAPAYYEDTDLAMRVRAAGERVVYQPESMIIHVEGASQGTDAGTGGKRHQTINHTKFLARWRDVLAEHHGANSSIAIPRRPRVLFVDHDVPRPDRDSGSIDAFNIMTLLRDAGYEVAFVPATMRYARGYSEHLGERGVRYIHHPHFATFRQAVSRLAANSDIVILSRGPIVFDLLPLVRRAAPHAKIIFNAVDLHYLRLTREADLLGDKAKLARAQEVRKAELSLVQTADATIVVSIYEKELLRVEAPTAKVYTIPILRERPLADVPSFAGRRDIVFVGGFQHPPNVDGILWFANHIWPLLQERGFRGRLIIVGSDAPPEVARLAERNISVLGHVRDLDPVFNACRMTVAPLRYGAGIKGKVVTSLGYGVPAVATSTAVEGSGLENGAQILVADNPRDFADAVLRLYTNEALWQRLSANALAAFDARFSLDAVRPEVLAMMQDLKRPPPTPASDSPFSRVVGLLALPRSGTTMLTSVIGVHPDVAAEFEPWNNARNSGRNFTSEGSDSVKEFCRQFAPPTGGKNVLFIKETTKYLDYVDNLARLLESVSPPARRELMILVRNPFHIFLSDIEARREWWGERGLEASGATFDDWGRHALHSFSRLMEVALRFDALIVSYERLVTDPAALPRLIAELGLEYNWRQAEYHLFTDRLEVRGDMNASRHPRPVAADALAKREAELRALLPEINRSPAFESMRRLAEVAGAVREMGIVRATTFFRAMAPSFHDMAGM
jgi:GT2 family glycosyltransferase